MFVIMCLCYMYYASAYLVLVKSAFNFVMIIEELLYATYFMLNTTLSCLATLSKWVRIELNESDCIAAYWRDSSGRHQGRLLVGWERNQ